MSTYTPSLGLELITPGSQAGLWGNTTNNSLNLIDQAITGVTPISFAAASGTTYTLTDFNGAEDEARAAVLNITGSATGSNTVVIPNKQKTYLVRNNTGRDVVFQTPTPSASYSVGAGYSILIFCDGNNNVFTGIASPGVGTLSVNAGGTGNTTFLTGGFIKSAGGTSSLTASQYVALGSEVSGVLPVASGGTGKTTLASGALLFGNGTGAVGEFVGPSGSSGQVATWNGSGWVAQTPTASGISAITAGTGISVSGSTNVTVTNTGVLSVSAGAGISVTGTGGNLTVSAVGGTGTVTSVGLSGGTTGLTVTGTNPITTSGTFTLGGTLAVTNGGTGASSLDGAGIVTKTGSQTISGSKTFSAATAFNAATTVSFNATGGGRDMLVLDGCSTTDTASGAVIKMTNPNAGSTVRNKYLRIGNDGTLQVLNSSYLAAILILDDNSNLTVNGNITTLTGDGFKTGGGNWAAISDGRLKNNPQPLSGALGKITSLNPVTYQWKHDTQEPTTGFIAQDVKKVIPTAVIETAPTDDLKDMFEDGEKVLAIGWKNDMMAYLVGAIKELKAELDLAKARIAELESK